MEQSEFFIDWNKKSLDELVEILENKFRFDSSSTAKAVIELCNFYRNTKTISLDRIKVKKTQNRSWFSRLFY